MAQVQCQHCGAMTSDEGATCQSCGGPLGGSGGQAPAPSPFPTPVVGGQPQQQAPMKQAQVASPSPPPPAQAAAPAPAQAPPQAPPQAPAPVQAPPQSQTPATSSAQAAAPTPQPGAYPPPQQQPGAYPPPQQPPGAYPAPAAPYYGAPAALLPGQQMAKDAVPLRVVSIIIDLIIIGVVQQVVALALAFTFFYGPGILGAVFAFLYFALLEGTQGQTLGKMVLGLKVVKEDMTPITMEQAFIRAADIFLWGLTFGIVALIDLIFVLENGQRLGDRYGHTVVIKVQ